MFNSAISVNVQFIKNGNFSRFRQGGDISEIVVTNRISHLVYFYTKKD